MIQTLLPSQLPASPGERLAEPHRRLMAAVLQSVVDDCRSARSEDGAARNPAFVDQRRLREAIDYVSSTDRRWPFSFENLCDALGLDADHIRSGLALSAARAAERSMARIGLPRAREEQAVPQIRPVS
jgi:hypothetical protein